MHRVLGIFRAAVFVVLIALSVALLPSSPSFAQAPQSKFAEVNGVRLHYLVAGKGDPVVLLHGFAETSHMWRPLIAKLADRHTVIAPDLRGFGQSASPEGWGWCYIDKVVFDLSSRKTPHNGAIPRYY